MNKFWILLIVSLSFFSAKNAQYNIPKSALKKIDKTLASIWPEETISKKAINLKTEDQKKLSFKLTENTLYNISINNQLTAYLFLASAKSKIMTFDYMVVFNPDLSILKVKVLVYREEYGGEIGSKRWLRQFEGKKDPKRMKFGEDIQGISGATISARSITYDVKKVMAQLIELKQKGFI